MKVFFQKDKRKINLRNCDVDLRVDSQFLFKKTKKRNHYSILMTRKVYHWILTSHTKYSNMALLKIQYVIFHLMAF